MVHKRIVFCKTCNKRFKTYFKKQTYCSIGCVPRKGEDNPKWRGGRIASDDYIYLFKPDHPFATQDGYVLEHRLVMEKAIGRYLKPKEAIHHLNHNRADNRIENLHLCESNGKHFIENHLVKRDKLGRFKKVKKSIR